jgi:predicted transcriptional regulator
LIKDEQEDEPQPVPAAPAPLSPVLAPLAMQTAQYRLLLLGVLNGNPVGLALTSLQNFAGLPSDTLRDSVSELRKKGLAEVEVADDPLNPIVKITPKGQEQLALWS